MQTKNIVIISSLTVIGLLLSLFWVVAPALMKDKVVGVIAFSSADRRCFNYYKNEKDYFKDPDSAYIESSDIFTKKEDQDKMIHYYPLAFGMGYDSIVEIKVRARNSMGGYVSDSIYCPYKESDSGGRELHYNINMGIYFSTEKLKENCEKLQTPIGYYKPSDDIKNRCAELFGILLQ